MPQLLPFYFVSQLSYAFLALLFLTYIYSIYFIPTMSQLNVVRMYFTYMLVVKWNLIDKCNFKEVSTDLNTSLLNLST